MYLYSNIPPTTCDSPVSIFTRMGDVSFIQKAVPGARDLDTDMLTLIY